MTVGMATIRFYVNVDHVATIREARRTDEPDPLEAARACLRGGADGITVHLREDRRHIQDADVRRLMDTVEPINLELACDDDILALATELRPHQATFVPERREEVTTEGGLRLLDSRGRPDSTLRGALGRVGAAGIRTSLFIDPDPDAVDAAAALGAHAIELHTGDYANTYRASSDALHRLEEAAHRAKAAGLAVHAGHGLTMDNVTPVAAIPEVEELSIGHHLVARSIFFGLESVVRAMRDRIDAARV
jgi:pyridoxine 5-phosphate synthase